MELGSSLAGIEVQLRDAPLGLEEVGDRPEPPVLAKVRLDEVMVLVGAERIDQVLEELLVQRLVEAVVVAGLTKDGEEGGGARREVPADHDEVAHESSFRATAGVRPPFGCDVRSTRSSTSSGRAIKSSSSQGVKSRAASKAAARMLPLRSRSWIGRPAPERDPRAGAR